MAQCLGASSLPYPKDDKGYAEAVVATGCGGRDAIVIGARDTRTADTVGALEPGDTVLHSTGPNQAAQVQCREKTRQVLLATKDSGGEGIMLMLDGSAKKVVIMAFGSSIEMSPDGVSITSAGQFTVNAPVIALMGHVLPGGSNAMQGMAFMVGPMTGSPGGPASVPLMPAMGISPAT
jgi:hypothetical protein